MMKNGMPLDPALLAGQTYGQSVFQAILIIAFLGFFVWTIKLVFEE